MKPLLLDSNFYVQATDRPLFPHSFSPKVTLKERLPRILLSWEAYEDMSAIIAEAKEEIGWLGIVERRGSDFLIGEIFLPDQFVSGTVTEITPDGLAKLAGELLARENGIELVSKLRFWGHSHVYMGTTPSGQDERQLALLSEDCPDFFIRGIFNKTGRAEFTLFFGEKNMVIEDVEWGIYHPENQKRAKWVDEIKSKATSRGYVRQSYGQQFPVVNNDNGTGAGQPCPPRKNRHKRK